MLSNSDDNGNGTDGDSHQNHPDVETAPQNQEHGEQQQQQQMSQNSLQVESSSTLPGTSSNSNINVNNNQDNQIENPVELPVEVNAMDENPPPPPPPPPQNGNNLDLDINIELINNEEVLEAQQDFDADAEEFRRRFYEAISRRNLPEESPAQYEEFDEDDNIDLIEEIIEDDDDEEDDDEDSSQDEGSTGPPSSRDDHEMDSDENLVAEREVASSSSAVPIFDLQLPQLHSYLGNSMESLSGRTVLEEGNVIEIPLVLLEFHLVPGQTLPLTIFHSSVQSALRRCIPNNRHFGIVHSGLNDINFRSPLPKRALGTTAEIFEFQEGREGESHIIPGRGLIPFPEKISIKAKGRHRFNVLSTYRQSDGHLMAKVKIRPEISLRKPWGSLMSSNHRHMFPLIYTMRTDSSISKPVRERWYSHLKSKHLKTTTATHSNSKTNDTNKENQQDNNSSTTTDAPSSSSSSTINPSHNTSCTLGTNSTNRKINRYYSAMTPWPYFVFELFDENILVDKIHKKLTSDLSSLAPLANAIPHDPMDLSFWLAQNLTMNDSLRLKMLKMDTSIERLSFANKLMDKVSRVIECNHCHSVIANHCDIFSMSVEGPQGTYVNPHGFVHELITVTKIKGIVYRGVASTEASWFPGYSWRIMECRGCSNHVGWKFKAKERLKPKKFYGLARRSVSFKYDFSMENECPSL